jgi:hypothetical protein
VVTARECIDREALDMLYVLELPSRQERKIVQLCDRWSKERSATVNVRYDKSEDGKSLVPRDASVCELKAWMMRCLLWRSYYRIVLDIPLRPLSGLFHLTQILAKRGWDIGGYRGTSVLVERKEKHEAMWDILLVEQSFPQRELDILSEYVFEQTKLSCTLRHKRLLMTEEDRNFGKIPLKKRIYYVLEVQALKHDLRRSGLLLMAPHKRIPQVFLPIKQAEN